MALTILFDNNPYDTRLKTGWGFAAWLEYGGHTVLFDTGADGAVLLDNMAALGLDPEAVEIVVLSHIHGDHTGGLAGLLAVNPRVTVYLPKAFPAQFKEQVRAAGPAGVEVDAPLEILPGLWSTGQMGTDIVEQALVAKTAEGLVVVTGCAHPGVDVVATKSKAVGGDQIHLVVGGFHLGGASRERIEEIIAGFRQLGVQKVAPCHCTGDEATALFRQAFGEEFVAVGAGWQWQSEAVAWELSGQGIPAQIGVAAVAIAPGNSRVIYLAAYEPGGLYRSDDGGASWRTANVGLEPLAPLAIGVHPDNPDAAWVGTMSGGYRTTDGGHSWQPMAGLPLTPLYALAITPDGRSLYAGGEVTGTWRSGDGGQTWSSEGLTGPHASTLSLAVAPDGSVLAGTAGEGVWASRDGGQSWQVAGAELAGAYVSTVAAGPDGRLYALASGRLYLSLDGGGTWETVGPAGFEALSFGFAALVTEAGGPDPTGRLYLGSRGEGLAVSVDGGQRWAFEADELLHTDIICLVADPAIPGRAFLGTRHNGLHRTVDGGASWQLVSGAIGQPVIAALAQDPANPQVYFAGTLDGTYHSDDGGEHWRLVSGAMGKLFVQGLAVSPTGERIYAGTRTGIFVGEDGGTTWRRAAEELGTVSVFCLAIDPHDAESVYAGSWGHNVLSSTDGGQTWAPIHHGLETLSVHAVAVDPGDSRVLYAGTVEAVYRSTDGGESWQASALADRPLTTFSLAIDPDDPGRVFAGTTTGVYRSTDAGQTWQPTGHESMDATVTALALWPDNADQRTILAGTEHHGLFRSIDGGAHWRPWGVEGASVYAILVDRAGTVWLGTDRGLFRSR